MPRGRRGPRNPDSTCPICGNADNVYANDKGHLICVHHGRIHSRGMTEEYPGQGRHPEQHTRVNALLESVGAEWTGERECIVYRKFLRKMYINAYPVWYEGEKMHFMTLHHIEAYFGRK